MLLKSKKSKIILPAALICILGLPACNYITGGTDNSIPPSALTEIKPEKTFTKLWSVNTGKGTKGHYLRLTPLLLSNNTITVDALGVLQSRDLKTGKLIWSKDLNKSINQGVAGNEQMIFVSTKSGELLALNPSNGEQLWEKTLVKSVLNNPTADNDAVYVQTTDGTFYSLNKSTGKENWSYHLPNPDLTLYTTSSPLVWKDLVISGFAGGQLVVFNKKTGMPKWSYQVAEPSGNNVIKRMVDIAAKPFIDKNTLYAVTYQGKLKAIDLNNGKVKWQYKISSINNIAASQDYLYVSDSEGKVLALNKSNGRVLWKQDKLYMRELSGADYIDKTVVVGDYAGYLHGLSQEHGGIIARTKLTNNAIRVAPQVKNGIIYVLDTSGELAAYKLQVG